MNICPLNYRSAGASDVEDCFSLVKATYQQHQHHFPSYQELQVIDSLDSHLL